MEGEPPPQRPAQDWGDFVDSGRRWQALAVSLIVVLILIAAVAAYLIKHKHKTQPAVKSPSASQTAGPQISSQTTDYSSPNFYLNVNIPKDWKITDNGGGTMAAVSPPEPLKSAAGANVTGQIVLTFRDPSQAALPEFDKGNANAERDSQKIAYSRPTQNQRASTYVSFLTYATSTTGIDGIYITGDFGYQKAQAVPKVDIQKVNPITSITFTKCSNSHCIGSTTPLTLAASEWDGKPLADSLIKILESLSIS